MVMVMIFEEEKVRLKFSLSATQNNFFVVILMEMSYFPKFK